MDKTLGFMKSGPDVRTAAKSGAPAMTPMRPAIPVSVPVVAGAALGGTTDVTVQQVGNTSALDTNPDARQIQPARAATNPDGTPAPPTDAPPAAATPAAVVNEPLPVNRQAPVGKSKQAPKTPKAPKKK